jgi:hypothetical protein
MERLARDELQSFQVNFMFPIEAQAGFGKVLADHPDHFHRRKKAGCDRRVTGRSPQQARMLLPRSFNRVKGRGANNQDAHDKKFLKFTAMTVNKPLPEFKTRYRIATYAIKVAPQKKFDIFAKTS